MQSLLASPQWANLHGYKEWAYGGILLPLSGDQAGSPWPPEKTAVFAVTENESVVSGTPARITIQLGEGDDGIKLLVLEAVIEQKQGADGGWYPAVVIREVP